MRLGTYLSSLTKTELLKLLDELNLNENEKLIVELVSQNKSYIEISYLCNVSVSTIDRIVKRVKVKIKRL